MGFLLKYLGGWQMYALIAATTLSLGFYSGMRWEKGANLADAEKQLKSLSIQAQEAIAELGVAWESEANRAKIQVEEWNLRSQVDEALLIELINGQDEIRRQFNDINTEITVVTDFGTCQLSPDAVRLLRAASESTRPAPVSGD